VADTPPPPPRAYAGWSAAEIAADQALAASIHALSQPDGLLSPTLDRIFEHRVRVSRRRTSKAPRHGRGFPA
jgi:hypothetical protein